MEKNNYLKYAVLNLRQNVYQLILTFVVSLYISFSIVCKFDIISRILSLKLIIYKLGQYTKRFFLGERLLKLALGFNYCLSTHMATLDCLLISLMFNNNEFKVLSWYLLCTVFLLYLYINVNKNYLHSFFLF